MKMLCLTISFFLIGLCIHYLFKDDYAQSIWSNLYFIWDKLKDLMLFTVPLAFIQAKEVRFSLYSVIGFCIIRILWQMLAIETDYVYASSYRIIDFMLVTLLYVIVSIWIYPTLKNGKKGSAKMVFKRSIRA